MIVGITGGSGCGKTTALQAFRDLGGLVLDCDAVYHDLLRTSRPLLDEIEARFPGVVTEGTLDRKKLGSLVFSDPAALEDLNRITHGRVKEEVLRQLSLHPGHAAIDAIALFEGGLAELCDCTVAITAPFEDRVQRLMARDGISREYALSRLHAQKPAEWFLSVCDHALENTGSRQEFYEKSRNFFHSLVFERINP